MSRRGLRFRGMAQGKGSSSSFFFFLKPASAGTPIFSQLFFPGAAVPVTKKYYLTDQNHNQKFKATDDTYTY